MHFVSSCANELSFIRHTNVGFAWFFYCVLLSVTLCYWVFMGSTGFHTVVLGFTGFE